jgi:hypothetical protein
VVAQGPKKLQHQDGKERTAAKMAAGKSTETERRGMCVPDDVLFGFIISMACPTSRQTSRRPTPCCTSPLASCSTRGAPSSDRVCVWVCVGVGVGGWVCVCVCVYVCVCGGVCVYLYGVEWVGF